MSEEGVRRFWLMALPLPESPASTGNPPQSLAQEAVDEAKWELFNKVRGRLFEVVGNLADFFPIDLPRLKVGTLDGLMTASAELERVDPQIESILSRTLSAYHVLRTDSDAVADDSTVYDFEVYGKRPETFLAGFSFNSAKYRLDEKLAELSGEIAEEAAQIDVLIRGKIADYQQAKKSSHSLSKGGRQAERDLDEHLSRDNHTNIHTSYLTTVYIILPKAESGWLKKEYASLAPMIVPDSVQPIPTKDNDSAVFSVTIFRKHLPELHNSVVKTRRWTLKEGDKMVCSGRDTASKLKEDLFTMHSNLVRLLRTNISEVFSCVAHLKFIRCFVEAALRYGLPPNYLFMVVNVGKCASRRRGCVGGTDSHLDPKIKRVERKLLRTMVSLLGQLQLPGISAIDLASFGSIEDVSEISEASATGEDAKLWSALNAGGFLEDAPFVRFIFEW